MKKITVWFVFVLLMVAASSTSLIAFGGKPTTPTTPLVLNGTYSVQWTLTDASWTNDPSFPKLVQGTLTFDSSGILAASDNLFILDANGASRTCSNTAMNYSGTGPGTLAGNAATFVVMSDIVCPGGVTYRPWLVMTLSEGGRQFWLTGSPASATPPTNYVISGRGILQ